MSAWIQLRSAQHSNVQLFAAATDSSVVTCAEDGIILRGRSVIVDSDFIRSTVILKDRFDPIGASPQTPTTNKLSGKPSFSRMCSRFGQHLHFEQRRCPARFVDTQGLVTGGTMTPTSKATIEKRASLS